MKTMREWLLPALLALLLAWATAAGSQMRLPMEIFFICQTASAATEVAYNIGDGVPGISALPAGCRWLHGEGAERRMAYIEEIENVVILSDGRIVYVARVERIGFPGGYSAGYLDGMS